MAEITTNKTEETGRTRAIFFEEGDVLIDAKGHIGLRTDTHVIREHESHPGSLFVMELEDSGDVFVKAPAGTSFTVTAK